MTWRVAHDLLLDTLSRALTAATHGRSVVNEETTVTLRRIFTEQS